MAKRVLSQMNKTISMIFAIVFILSCGIQVIPDSNAYVIVASQYGNSKKKHVRSFKCDESKGHAECAAFLYNEANKLIANGKNLLKSRRYKKAYTKFMKARDILREANIRTEYIKTNKLDEYQVIIHFKLQKSIRAKIKLCQKMLDVSK
jgi:flagellin-specific chaperone FliS